MKPLTETPCPEAIESREAAAPFRLDSMASVECPDLEVWALETGDPELGSWVEERLSTRDPYSVAAAVGMVLCTPRQLVAGEDTDGLGLMAPDSPTGRCVTWARALSEGQRSTLERLTIAELRRLLRELEELEDGIEPLSAARNRRERRAAGRALADPGYLAEVREALLAREDLAGVFAVLVESRSTSGDPLRDLLQPMGEEESLMGALFERVDEAGRAFVARLPEGCLRGEARLARDSWDPDAWWASLSR